MHSSIVLLAKPAGITSFTSLFGVKRALSTKKVGHTGTLDSFADGLLVVLTGSMTRLVPHITALSKTYQAVITFGEETDTLEVTGQVVQTAPLPTKEAFLAAVEQWKGDILQEPPVFSALHVDGARASDLARRGHDITLEKRPVSIYESKVLDMELVTENGVDYVRHALLESVVSKGTYIRALARDIARSAGSCGHLIGLRRTGVGIFKLEHAAGYESLPPMTIAHALAQKDILEDDPHIKQVMDSLFTPAALQGIIDRAVTLDRETAVLCGLPPVTLKNSFHESYNNGIRITPGFFLEGRQILDQYKATAPADPPKYAVFLEDTDEFCGLVSVINNHFKYEFVNKD